MGMLTLTVPCTFLRPSPRHSLQGFSIVTPDPLHVGQVLRMLINPWFEATCPIPPQVEHMTLPEPAAAPVPEQDSHSS
jgi:hypothetical protein